jgi:hypothetical protein
MLMHLLKLKLVSLLCLHVNNHILFDLECAALVKEGKVYGIGTEDMDVSEIFIFLLSSQSYFVGIDLWFRCTYTSFNI